MTTLVCSQCSLRQRYESVRHPKPTSHIDTAQIQNPQLCPTQVSVSASSTILNGTGPFIVRIPMPAYHGEFDLSNELSLHLFDSVSVTSEADGLLVLRTGSP